MEVGSPALIVRIVVRFFKRGHRDLDVRARLVHEVPQARNAEARDRILGVTLGDRLREPVREAAGLQFLHSAGR